MTYPICTPSGTFVRHWCCTAPEDVCSCDGDADLVHGYHRSDAAMFVTLHERSLAERIDMCGGDEALGIQSYLETLEPRYRPGTVEIT